MASIGHVAVAVAAARWCGEPARPPSRPRLWLVLAGLSLRPDLDVVGFAFGVPYGAEWGHRGASHSLLFGLTVGAAAGHLLRRRRLPLRWPELVCAAVVVSHGLLDTLTDGGRGVALLWPFSDGRIFAPWRPLPVAPLGLGLLSPWGLQVLAYEALLFLPVWIAALWPRMSGRDLRRHGD